MAHLVPFRALRPTPASAAKVAAVPYDVVNAEEAAALAKGNPLSFLHVSRAEIDLPADTNPYSEAVYARAVENFAALRQAAPLVVEDSPSVYAYRLQMGTHVQTGVAACFSGEEYDRDLIKKHERTRRDKEDDRTRHMLGLRAQTGPVFLTYKSSSDVNDVVSRVTLTAPLFDFTAVDNVRHTLWRAAPPETEGLVSAFARVPALYIADGHHRAASAARVRQQLAASGEPDGERDTFLAVAFPDDQMQVMAYNRVVRDLAGHSPNSLLSALGEHIVAGDSAATPSQKGEVAMFLAGRWYPLRLGDVPDRVDAASRLDVSRLEDQVLTPLLRIGDVRTDKRIDFVGGARGTDELERLVGSGAYAVAFSMFPVGVDDLMTISDAGGIMPPKSTWFEPKLRDGLLSHLI